MLIWSAQLRSRPEFYCFCQSAVTTAKFFPYSTNTVIGGCSNGTLLLWDVRAKAMPVQRSSISSEGHRYPITSLNVVGTQIANNIVSFSTDGTMSLWDVRQLSRPVRNPSRLTVNKPPRSTKPTSVQSVLTGRSSTLSLMPRCNFFKYAGKKSGRWAIKCECDMLLVPVGRCK